MAVLLILGLLCAIAAPAATVADRPLPPRASWVRISSPHFQVYTDLPADRGLRLLRRLEFLHHAFHSLEVGDADAPRPLRVFYFASEGQFRRYTNGTHNTGSFYTGAGTDYILLFRHADDLHVLSHEYGHYLLRNLPNAPDWLDEGFAEFCSTVDPSDSGVEFGRPPPYHLELVKAGALLDHDTFLNVDARALGRNDEGSAVFYAQSWAMVHMLMLSPEYRQNTSRFLRLLRAGYWQDDAFSRAFGKTLRTALAELRPYAGHELSAVLLLDIEPPASPRWASRALSASEVQRALSALAEQTHQLTE